MKILYILCDFNWEGIIAAIIGAFGVLVTAFFGFYQYKHNKWNENVSKERTVWLKEFRSEYGKIMKAISFIQLSKIKVDEKKCNSFDKYKNELINIILEAEEARYILISRINTNSYKGNEYNKKYKNILKNITFTEEGVTTFENENVKNEFIELTNKILEKEWKKVKKEAIGIKDEKYI